MLIIPVFLVTPVVLSRPGSWRSVVLTLLGDSVWIAGMGTLEHFVPGIAQALPGFIGNPDPLVAAGFQRASFSFYGSPIAVFICVMALPFSLAAWRWWPASWQRALTLAEAALQLVAIYISGYRSIWLLLAVQMGLVIVVQRRYLLGIGLVCLALVAYESLPAVTRERIESLAHILEGRPDDIDTSGQKRWLRAAEAFRSALECPMGRGWASSGWVHSDFIQVAAGTAASDVHAFRMPRRNHMLGRWVRHGGVYPDYQIRLLRRDQARWQEREVHAPVQVSGRIETLHHDLLHYDIPTISKPLSNLDRYTRYEADELKKKNTRFRWHHLLLRPLGAFLYRYLWLQGFRDGWRGLIVCAYWSMYVFWTRAKLWEMEELGLEKNPH